MSDVELNAVEGEVLDGEVVAQYVDTEASDKVADLVEYLVCALVEDADAISLDVTDGPEGTLIEITCGVDDAGRVIGKKGRTIKAIRTIARALGQRLGMPVEVEVLG